ncbi:MAG: prepilin peptidase [Aquificaceae bacterium]|nr:prepilin peptidase [Aquificaceae bacterium]MCX8059907.1 prepilin peptidase [Aquificaceae bacterium]MDW8097359.1 prepilin peptidase [Aquificaceae bacterium]
MLLQALEYAFLFALGASLGSFYNVLIYRLPRGMSLLSPPSHCPHCGRSIRWFHNVPIVSYLVLKGRCAYCGGRISLRYPLVETAGGLLAVLCRSKFEEPLTALVFFVFFSILLVASLIDWDTFLLPDSLTLGGLAFGLTVALLRQDFTLLESLLGALVGGGGSLLVYLYYAKVRKMEGLGLGDVKLLAFVGSVAGVWGVAYAVFLGALFGLAYALPIVLRHRSMSFALPFGPFLSLGVFAGIFLDLKTLLF